MLTVPGYYDHNLFSYGFFFVLFHGGKFARQVDVISVAPLYPFAADKSGIAD